MDYTPIEQFIIELTNNNITSFDEFLKLQRSFAKKSKTDFFTNDQLISTFHKLKKRNIVLDSPALLHFLKLKKTRSQSGLIVISVLTKPFPCPGHCVFCPSEDKVPKSYFSDEPAVMRAIKCKYDPYEQVLYRLKALEQIGHLTQKVSIRIVGGTWSYYDQKYREDFVKKLFLAANGQAKSQKMSLEEIFEINSSAKHRIIELSVETRPDFINNEEILNLRKLGVTKVELGVQSLDNKILKKSNRETSVQDIIDATLLLKNAAFKVSYQMMLNLPGSDIGKDLQIFEKLFSDPDFRPDHLKIYPLALIKETQLFQDYQKGDYKPYDKDTLVKLIADIKAMVPYYCRIERVIRDIPSEHIVEGGAKISNLRQVVTEYMRNNDMTCNCIRCREVKQQEFDKSDICLFRQDYEASDGHEIYLSFESKDRSKLLSMLRLRILSNDDKIVFDSLRNSTLIREIHTYGSQVGLEQRDTVSAQHLGFGKKLIEEAEKISRNEFSMRKISVIAGVGVRDYFKKQGYELVETYMRKAI